MACINVRILLYLIWTKLHNCPLCLGRQPHLSQICWSVISVTLATAAQNPASESSKFCCDSVSYCKIKKINWENICLLSFSMAHIHSTNKIWQIPQCSRKLSLLNPAFSVSELLPYPINLSLNQRPYNKQDRKQSQCIDCKDFKFISISVLNYRILWG